MFKKAKMSLYILAIVSVVAIFAIVLLSQGGFPSFDGDLTGEAKRALAQKNVPKASSGNALANRGTVERVPQRSALTVERAPVRQSGQQEIYDEDDDEGDCMDQCWDIVESCMNVLGADDQDLEMGSDEQICNNQFFECFDRC